MLKEKLQEFVHAEWDTLMKAKRGFFAALALMALAAAAFGWWFADYHYSGRIAGLTETLETKQFPAPVIKVVNVPVSDPGQTATINSQNDRLAEDAKTIENLSAFVRAGGGAPPSLPKVPRKTVASPPSAVSTQQSGGVAQGAGSSIQTVNQNGLPARSAYAAQLGALYTEGYLLLQKTSFKNVPDAEIDSLRQQFGVWRQKVIAFANANMCSDAAAYFLKPHRSSMDYSLPPKQNDLLDVISWSLDNLSDLKRNDAWDCK